MGTFGEADPEPGGGAKNRGGPDIVKMSSFCLGGVL